MRRLTNLLKSLASSSFNNSVTLTQCLTIMRFKSFFFLFVEISNNISHCNHLMHLLHSPSSSSCFSLRSGCQILYVVVPHGKTFAQPQQWYRAGGHVELYVQDTGVPQGYGKLGGLQIGSVFHLFIPSRCFRLWSIGLHNIERWQQAVCRCPSALCKQAVSKVEMYMTCISVLSKMI